MTSQNVALPSKISKFTWKHVVEKQPFAELTLQQFKDVALASNGWKHVRDSDFRYSINSGYFNLDEFVKEALWHFDEEEYEQCRGYTKTPRIGRAYHSLLKYGGDTVYKCNRFDDRMEDCWNNTLDQLHGSFRSCGVIPLEIAMTKIPLNTSAGFSFPGKKKGDVLPEAYEKVKEMIQTWKDGKQVEQIPCKLATRGHLSPVTENKTRCVWVAPIEHTILENMFFRGFYHQIFAGAHHRDRFMTGKDTIARLNEYLTSGPKDSFVNTDISGWDSLRARFVLKDQFYRVLVPHMQLTEPWHHLAVEYLIDAFIFTHLVLPDGTIIKKINGVPSGSFLTLLINSLAVYCCLVSALKYLEVTFHGERVLGDDFCFKINHMDDNDLGFLVEDVSACVLKFFDLVIKPEKVVATNVLEDRKFIGYQIKRGRLFREDRDLLLGMLYPESPVEDLATSFTRVFSFMLIGGFGSALVTRFYERYLGGYKAELDAIGPDLFDQDVMRSGNLRVFKHVFKIDLEEFDGFDIEGFRNLFSNKAPFFLTLGSRFMLQ
jgi:hypothetical protein